MKNKNSGFTLAEVVIAAGLLGTLAFGIMNFSRSQTKVQKRAESAFEVNTISNTMLDQIPGPVFQVQIVIITRVRSLSAAVVKSL